MATLKKQIWVKHLMKNFYPEYSFLQFAKDFSPLVEYDKITMTEVGIDPEVLINNTTYPITVAERTDTALEITLDLFETENTLIRRPEAVELAYEKLESVLYGHKMNLRTTTAKKAAHAFAPNSETTFTPVIEATGDDNGDGFKRLTVNDILLLKRRYDDLDIPKEGRYLVLDPKHTEDLIKIDLKSFKDITDFSKGNPKRFAGFNMLEFTKNPKYTNALVKIPFGSITAGNHSSFSFQKDEVMKADGSVKMYETKDDPKERATIVGFDKRFVALPIRNKGIGAIVSVPV
ncbi:hypothetical protein [Polaribacter cellanae]|uniref:Major capsid protein n=1 Tax=Polaribacter cellanae TaxID=2818493 RepID=A0A975H6E9_9FLAO|nr:hypothetical protein [Polaribacter cellanae]QTE22396.1 hypothetical protein J3359_16585 [Polaribacter cellanae]